MKIGPLDTTIAAPPPASDRKSPAAAPAKAAAPGTTVELSPLATMKLDAQGEGSFDAAKVAAMSAAISEGRFVVNAEAIADKLLDNAQELLDRNRR